MKKKKIPNIYDWLFYCYLIGYNNLFLYGYNILKRTNTFLSIEV